MTKSDRIQMKTRYRHIHFEEVNIPAQEMLVLSSCHYWLCKNNKDNSILGRVDYYEHWHKYVASFYDNAVFDETCLADIADFLRQLNKSAQSR